MCNSKNNEIKIENTFYGNKIIAQDYNNLKKEIIITRDGSNNK